MQFFNSSTRYGVVTKVFHWTVFLLFLYQYVVANIMLRISQSETFLGFTQGVLYNWHKSIGLVVLLVVLLRLTWRRTTRLPDWAESLSEWEKNASHWIENTLYVAMFVMPISGYLFVMSGDYGVMLFGRIALPNPIGKIETMAEITRWLHIITGWVILITLVCHVGLGLKHQLINRDRFLNRMLPFTHQQ